LSNEYSNALKMLDVTKLMKNDPNAIVQHAENEKRYAMLAGF